MTSDAKVGLLLGLVFIVIIAFLINGLPNLLRNGDDAEAIVQNAIATESSSTSWSQKDQAEKVATSFNKPAVKRTTASSTSSTSSQTTVTPRTTVRPQTTTYRSQSTHRPRTTSSYSRPTTRSYTPTLSSANSTAMNPTAGSTSTAPSASNYSAASRSQTSATTSRPSIRIPSRTTATTNQTTTAAARQSSTNTVNLPKSVTVAPTTQRQTRTASRTIPAVKTAKTESYKVVSGDNLTKIAIKFYGKSEGSKYKNMMKIYEANKKTMRSPDAIYKGQKLIIPALTTGYVSTAPKASASRAVKPKVVTSGNGRYDYYVVQKGDSLWTIAEEKLGNGKRYWEIAKLNKTILPNENSLKVGMKIQLPKH